MNLSQFLEYLEKGGKLECPSCHVMVGPAGSFKAYVNQPGEGNLYGNGKFEYTGQGDMWIDFLRCSCCGHEFEAHLIR